MSVPAAAEALEVRLAALRARVDGELGRRLPTATGEDPGRLAEAMRYAALGPGKRLRPALVVWACEAAGGREEDALGAACALEMIHAYSLVHDDLPCCDDDDERRGRPTCHRAFGETTALLAGDALLTLAFEVLADEGARLGRPAPFLTAVGELARRAGPAGMVRGQARDLAEEGAPLDLAALERLHREKTGALFTAAAVVGACAAGAGARTVACLSAYGAAIGLAFQHLDDLDDREHGQHAVAAIARVHALVTEAAGVAAALGPGAAALVELAAALDARAGRHARG